MLSIVLPVHNEAKHLSSLFQCLIDQTASDWEAVVVDDGSTDETATIARAWANEDARIRFINPQRKIGKVSAFNLAFRESRGDQVCHIGGDDLIPPDGLEIRINSLRHA